MAKRFKCEQITAEDFRSHFWAGVQPGDDSVCWPWMRSAARGYGQTFFKGRLYKAHRIALYLTTGEWAKVAMHDCDNRLCCNPNHIINGTHKQNTQDMLRKGRHNVAFGERSGQSKLNAEQVRSIRAEYDAGGTSHSKLAAKYGISPATVGGIVTRKFWRHLA